MRDGKRSDTEWRPSSLDQTTMCRCRQETHSVQGGYYRAVAAVRDYRKKSSPSGGLINPTRNPSPTAVRCCRRLYRTRSKGRPKKIGGHYITGGVRGTHRGGASSSRAERKCSGRENKPGSLRCSESGHPPLNCKREFEKKPVAPGGLSFLKEKKGRSLLGVRHEPLLLFNPINYISWKLSSLMMEIFTNGLGGE